MKAKTLLEKQREASQWEIVNRLGVDGNRKPYGVKPIYHHTFGPYLLWIVTGRYAAYSKITNVDELNRKLIEHFGLPFKKTEIIPHLQLLLAQDTDPLLFNPYRYLLDTLETENESLKDTSTQLQKVLHWLADSMEAADIQARQFHPVTYNVAPSKMAAVQPPQPSSIASPLATGLQQREQVVEQQVSPFEHLLRGYSLNELTTLLLDLKLIGADNKEAASASPGAWVGVIYALLDKKSPRIRGSKAAIQRAFHEVFGASVEERTVQAGITKNSNEAADVKARALSLLPK
jgi:hypothetical protein